MALYYATIIIELHIIITRSFSKVNYGSLRSIYCSGTFLHSRSVPSIVTVGKWLYLEARYCERRLVNIHKRIKQVLCI